MTTTLVSFLGRARQNPGTGYREAAYRFADGTTRRSTFFGLALREALGPDRVVVLGTRGSMWDVLVEHLSPPQGEEDLRLRLIDAATTSDVTESLLSAVTPLVERALGLPCTLRLIEYGRDAGEQTRTLEAVAESVPSGAVYLDLTHGFRHLAALGLLSAFFLERVARVEIAGLYYGALDMTERGITPVVRLDGLLGIQRWIDALDRYDQSGDYGVFSPLLMADGVPADKARCLEEAAFHERTSNVADAARKIGTVLSELQAPLSGASELFRRRLRERLEWARTGTTADQQRRLAYIYLERHDFLRAAVFATEALVALRVREDGTPAQKTAANRIHSLRNALAHGDPPDWKKVREALGREDRLYRMLRKDLKDALA